MKSFPIGDVTSKNILIISPNTFSFTSLFVSDVWHILGNLLTSTYRISYPPFFFIGILVCSCAYPCTDECGSDVKVGLVVKLIRGKVWITNSITRANEMWARSPRLALSRRTPHYLKVLWTTLGIHVGTIIEVGTISAYLSFSNC